MPSNCNTPVRAEFIAVCICAPVAKLDDELFTVPTIAFITGVVPPDELILFAVPPTDVTPELELVPAPINVRISKALILVFKLGAEPFDNTAGKPVSVTLALFVVILLAWVLEIPTLALFVVILLACVPVIVVVLPAFAVVEVVPITKLDVPAPISDLTSEPEIPLFKLGVEPLDNIAGTPCKEAEVIYPAPFVIWLLLIAKVTAPSPCLFKVTVPPDILPLVT